MTNREFLTSIVGIEGINEEIKTFAEQSLAKLDERNSKRRTTLSPTQKENEEIKAKILDFLTVNEKKSASEVAIALELSSTSKASALLRQLVDSNKVVATDEKVKGKGKHKVYSLA